MRRRFIVFSSILFLLIFIPGSVAFIVLMEKFQYKNAGHELTQAAEIEKTKLEAYMNSEIAVALKMADSPLILRHFLNPADSELKKTAFDEIEGYRRAFAGNNVFWISSADKKYYFGDKYIYTLDPAEESSQWYNEIMEYPERYRLMVNFNIGIKKIMLWIDAPVFDNKYEPVGVVGTGVNLSDFVDAVYQSHELNSELYFFNDAGEITGANDVSLVENKISITGALVSRHR
jgi:methyl-accepting chemotaxis protein